MNQDAPTGWDGWLAPRWWVPLFALPALLAGLFAVLYFADDEGDATSGSHGESVLDAGGQLRQPVHWHADVTVLVEGEPIDLGQPRYVSTEDQERSENVHVHDPRHTLVHVHREQTTWGEFFASLGWQLSDTCLTLDDGSESCSNGDASLRFFVNGVQVDDLRFQPIGDLDRVLLAYGTETPDDLLARFDQLVSDEACIPSGLCADRFPPGGIEEEPCSVGNDTCN